MIKSSFALHYAHKMQKNAAQQMLLATQNKPTNWAERVKMGWYYVHLREWLKEGIVTFSYWKNDGSIREAKGTLNALLIPADKKPKGSVLATPHYEAVAYFDLDKQEWRSFSVTCFIGLVSRWELSPFRNKQDPKEKRSKRENHAGALIS